ncbi:DNA polymerase I, partial [bacterium]|nr:DNA polymerase I [bacterium]
ESRAAPLASYRCVEDAGELAALGARLAAAARFAVDTETTGLDPLAADLVGISVALVPGEASYLPVAGRCAGTGLALADLQAALAPALASGDCEKLAQNLKFDAQVLARHGLPIAGPCFDTMLASYCVDPGRRSHGLDALALELLGHQMIPYEALFAAGDKERDITRVPLDRLTQYAAEDADFTLRLADALAPALAAAGVERLFRDLEMPLVPVLAAMEAAGIGLDTAQLAALGERMERARGELEARIHAAAGRAFAIGSPKQLAAVLFEELKLPAGRKTKTGHSTDEQVLGELAGEHPIAGWVLEWRELSKLKSTYVDVLPAMVLPATGRVHTRFNQAVAATGRLSSSDPNLQNIPVRSELGKEIRRAFVPAPGLKLASFDYSQVELRILAALSGDAALREAFAGERDIHRWTAARLSGKAEAEIGRDERDRAKAVNFGVLYGMGAHGLAQRLRIPRAEAQRFIEEYFAAFPGVRRWIDATLLAARRDGAVSTLLGRRRALPELASSNPALRAFGERVAINTPIQGSAADLIKLAMLRVHDWLGRSGLGARLLLQVHDELLFEAAPGELAALAAGVIPLMEGVGDLAVPLKVEWGSGDNWLEAH